MGTKMMSTPRLIRLNQVASHKGLNRCLASDVFEDIDPEGIHIVHTHFVHGDAQCVRCVLFVKMVGSDDPAETTLDMTFEDFAKLSEVPKEVTE